MFDLADCRRFYAEEIRLSVNITLPRLIDAFATVPREKFLGPGPWNIAVPNSLSGATQYVPTPDADPRHVYHNLLISLDQSADLNNGHPGTLALFINALELAPGNRVYHLGCGVGYYTAIMAEMVGPQGSLLASEIHPELGPLAQKYLSDRPNIIVHLGDGTQFEPVGCDAILINAGVTHPMAQWLDSLNMGGRLVLPITFPLRPNLGQGLMMKIIRQPSGYSAKVFSSVGIFSCSSGRDPQLEPLLRQAMLNGALMKVKSIRRDLHDADTSCVVHGANVCFNLAELAANAANQ